MIYSEFLSFINLHFKLAFEVSGKTKFKLVKKKYWDKSWGKKMKKTWRVMTEKKKLQSPSLFTREDKSEEMEKQTA